MVICNKCKIYVKITKTKPVFGFIFVIGCVVDYVFRVAGWDRGLTPVSHGWFPASGVSWLWDTGVRPLSQRFTA